VYGNASRFWLRGLHIDSYHQLAPTIPEALYCAYQLTFAIITPALIVGSFADRMRFGPMLVFVTLWHFLVYCPIAHACWHPEGFLFKAGDLDYAGGNVVHIASGMAGLVSSVIIGHRKGFLEKEVFEPHNVMLTCVGASMLWVGWFGFNAGSAVAANQRAAYALLATHISAAVGALTWMFTEWYVTGSPKLTGVASGAIAGLVCITPGSGFVDMNGAFFFGLLSGPICYFSAQLKHYLGYDDALDAFGVHGIGGMLGGVLTGFFATNNVIRASPPINGVFYANTEDGGHQLGIQIYAIVVVGAYSAFASFLILIVLDKTMGLRISDQEEQEGMDSSFHGESLVVVEKYQSVDNSAHKSTVEMIPMNAVAPVSQIV
jgi:Amt family ammonium transporter